MRKRTGNTLSGCPTHLCNQTVPVWTFRIAAAAVSAAAASTNLAVGSSPTSRSKGSPSIVSSTTKVSVELSVFGWLSLDNLQCLHLTCGMFEMLATNMMKCLQLILLLCLQLSIQRIRRQLSYTSVDEVGNEMEVTVEQRVETCVTLVRSPQKRVKYPIACGEIVETDDGFLLIDNGIRTGQHFQSFIKIRLSSLNNKSDCSTVGNAISGCFASIWTSLLAQLKPEQKPLIFAS